MTLPLVAMFFVFIIQKKRSTIWANILLCSRGFSWCAIMHNWTQLSKQIYLQLSHIIIIPYLLPTNGRCHVPQKQL